MNPEISARPGAGCFWHHAREQFGPPNIHWCEQSYCSIIEQPATTWSNMAIMAVGFFILWQQQKANKSEMKYFGAAVFLMGLFSFVYHAANNWPLQILDFVGMYLFTGIIITFNFKRLKSTSTNSMVSNFIIIFTLNMLLIPLFHYLLKIHIQYIVLVNALTIAIQEYFIRQENTNYSLRYWKFTLGFIVIAQLFSLMDANRIYCNPSNLFIHGHALWHVVSAISAYFAYLFYQNLGSLRES